MYQASIIFKDELQPKKGVKIPFGLHMNCSVTGFEIGENYVDINFENVDGLTHNKRLWAPNGNFPSKKADGTMETKEEAMAREERSRLSHLVKVAHIFLGEDGLDSVKAETYNDFVSKIVKAVSPKLSSKKVNLKLIYDSEGMYSTFGNFPDYIEEYVEGQPNGLAFTKWERENRCTRKQSEDPRQDSAENKALDDILGI